MATYNRSAMDTEAEPLETESALDRAVRIRTGEEDNAAVTPVGA